MSPSKAASPRPSPRRKPQAPKGTEERHFTITAAGTATVKGGGDDVAWTFNAIPDRPPTIALAKEPEAQAARLAAAELQARGRLRRGRRAGDLRAQAAHDKPAPAEAKPPRPLFDAPNFTLVLPQARTRSGRGHDHQGPVRASLGRRRRDDDARRPRRGQQRGPLGGARDAVAGAAVRQAAAARADRAAPQSRARCQRQGPRAGRARCADDRAGAVHPGDQRLSRPALDLLAACARRERRRPARRGGAAVVDGGVPRGRQRLGDREGACARRRTPCARRWSAAPPTKRSRS